MQRLVLVLSAVSLMRVCGTPAEQAPSAAPSTAAPAATQPGGQVASAGRLQVEVAPIAGGQLALFVRDANGQPVEAADVRLSVQPRGGERREIALTYVPAAHAYGGRAFGLPAGSYEPEVQVTLAAGEPAVQLKPSAIELAESPALPPPQYQGRVQGVGPYAVEVVVARSRELVLTLRDASGSPVSATEITAPTVVVRTGGQPYTLRAEHSGQGLLVRLPSEPDETVAVEMPSLAVRGVEYRHVLFASVARVPEPPPPLVVAVPAISILAPETIHAAPAVTVVAPTPAVVVQAPPPAVVVPAPAVVIEAPSIEVGFGLGVGVIAPGHGHAPRPHRAPHGHGHGHGRGGRFW